MEKDSRPQFRKYHGGCDPKWYAPSDERMVRKISKSRSKFTVTEGLKKDGVSEIAGNARKK